MGWVRIDDHFNEHPKLAQVGPLGWGVWVAGLAYCNRNLTDGFIPRGAALSLGCFEFELDGEFYGIAVTSGAAGGDLTTDWVINLLVSAGLWRRIKGGYRVHDYHDYQPSRERILAERERGARRQQRSRNGSRNGVTDRCDNGETDGATDSLVTAAPTPTPTKKGKKVSDTSSDADRADEKSTEDDKRLCRLLAELARARNPKFKVRSRARWLTEMRLLRERDGNTPEEIEQAIRWVFTDPSRDAQFWADTIQSAANLREHFSRVWAKMSAGPRLRAVPNVEDSAAFLRRRGVA